MEAHVGGSERCWGHDLGAGNEVSPFASFWKPSESMYRACTCSILHGVGGCLGLLSPTVPLQNDTVCYQHHLSSTDCRRCT
ncbi:hypothetical protein KC352_g17 [Hortaea werneckii]|nr:hypothetical protein KC352_g17 [Hortaea werneckii]